MKKKEQKEKRQKEKILIPLSGEEITSLKNIVKKGESNARVTTRARILLLSHKGKTNKEIIEALDCWHDMIHVVRKRYKDRGSIDKAIHDAPRPGQPKKITKEHEAFVIATVCTDAPEGHGHWTLEALRDKLLETYEDLTSVSHERIRHILLRSAMKPWREKNVVRSKAHA